MIIRRKIDANGQVSLDARGRFVRDPSQASHVVIALRSTYGSSPVAPTFGNKIAAVPENMRRSIKVEIEDAYRQAVAHLVTAGLIWDLAVIVHSVSAEGVNVEVKFTDASGEQNLVIS